MTISVKGHYALQAIFDLATQPPGIPVKIGDIAKRQKIPQKFLELILAGLKQGGFVESRRGAEGGYLLVRPPETLTAGEVLRFVEGPGPGRARSQAQGRIAFRRNVEPRGSGGFRRSRSHYVRRTAPRLGRHATPNSF